MQRSRIHVWLIWLAAAAFISPQLGALADSLHNEHNYCATHDDFTHGEAHAQGLALRTKSHDGAKPHTHCEAWKAGLRPVETYERCPDPKAPKATKRTLIEPQARPVPQLPIFALAPKTSPPSLV
jgi:hypothetical protein